MIRRNENSFNKALFLLDKGEDARAEALLREIIDAPIDATEDEISLQIRLRAKCVLGQFLAESDDVYKAIPLLQAVVESDGIYPAMNYEVENAKQCLDRIDPDGDHTRLQLIGLPKQEPYERGSLTTSLDEILQFHSSNETVLPTILKEPLSAGEILRLCNSIDLEPSDELMDIYQWRNGTKYPEGELRHTADLIPFMIFISLEEAVSTAETMRKRKAWSKDWLPILTTSDGVDYAGSCMSDYYAVSFSNNGEPAGHVISYPSDSDDWDVEFISLSTMLKSISGAMSEGIIFKSDDPQKSLDTNYNELVTFCAQLNPGLKWYSERLA